MPPRSNPNIPDEEFIETLNPGITRPQDDFLNRQQAANDNEPLAEGATYSTAQNLPPAGGAANNNEPQGGQTIDQNPQTNVNEHPNRKISNGQAGLMIGTAIVFDLISMIPILGTITSAVGAPLVFGMWFVALGVPLLTPKKAASWGLSWLAEIIPALGNALPLVTVGIVLVILIDRAEELTGLNITSLAKGNVSDLASIKKNLGGQIQAKFIGATPPPLQAGGVANDNNPRITTTPVNPAVPQRQQMVDNVRKV